MFEDVDSAAIPQCLNLLLEAVQNKPLVSLDVSSNQLDRESCVYLQNVLQKFDHLVNLDISNCKLDSAETQLIA